MILVLTVVVRFSFFNFILSLLSLVFFQITDRDVLSAKIYPMPPYASYAQFLVVLEGKMTRQKYSCID